MVTDITCRKEDMLLVNYEAPNGEKKHNRESAGIADIHGTIALHYVIRLGSQLAGDAKQIKRVQNDVLTIAAAFSALITAKLKWLSRSELILHGNEYIFLAHGLSSFGFSPPVGLRYYSSICPGVATSMVITRG
jgi:hypothetical protein